MEGLLRPRRRVLAGALLALIVAGALGLRSVNLDWGLPEVYEEATPVREAVEFWGEPAGRIDLNPGFFKYPSLTLYLQFGVQAARYFGLSLAGQVDSLNDFREVLAGDLGRAVLHGRWLQAVLGALLVLPAFGLGRRLGGAAAGWGSALAMAVLPAVVTASQRVTPDVALALFGGCSLAAAAALAETGRRRDYLWCGLFLGLAASAKYPGALLVAGLLIAHAMAARGRGPAGLVLSSPLWQALFVAAVAFAATSPYVLLDFSSFRADLAFERQHMALGHLGRETGSALGFYWTQALPREWTWSVVGAALIGLVVSLADPRRRRAAAPVAGAVSVFLLVVMSWRMAAPHYLLPIAVGVCAWAGTGLAFVSGLARRWRMPAVIAATGLVLAVPVARSWGDLTGRPREDSRTAAAVWMTENVPPGSTVLLERYGPEPQGSWNLLYLPFHGITPHLYDPAYSPALYTTFDYFVLSSGVHSRYLAHPREYPAQVEFYLAVAEGFDEVARFSSPDYTGPSILVYKRPATLAWGELDKVPAAFFNGLRNNRPLAEYFAQLGGILGRQGRSDLADRILDAAIEMDPRNGRIWGSRGAVQLGDGRFEDALTSLRKARDLEPDRADIAYNLATLYRRMGELTQAAGAYRAALAADPSLEDGYIGLARVLVEEVHYAEARVVLRAFLNRFPRSDRRGSAETALKELATMGPGKP